MSRTAITLKFKMRLYLDKASYWAEKLLTDINLPPLLPDEDNNFGGSLGLHFRKWCHQMQTKNWFVSMRVFQEHATLGGVLGISSDGDDQMEPKVKTQKIPRASCKTQNNPWTKRTTQPGHYRFFLMPQKNPYSNQATPKNTCQIFVPKKIPESNISNPKKSFDHPRHLKSRVPPPPSRGCNTAFSLI